MELSVAIAVLPLTHSPHLHDRHEKLIPTLEEYLGHQRGLLCTDRTVRALLLAITPRGAWVTKRDDGYQIQVAVYKASTVPSVLSLQAL